MIVHPLAPIFNEQSKILILGSFPSVKSRENLFYYGHPQNRFWKILHSLSGEFCGETPQEKTAFLLKHGIALWDVIAECEIEGSSDSSIKNPLPADISVVLKRASIEKVLLNGKKAYQLFLKFNPAIGIESVCLPSTSPANAMFDLQPWQEELANVWRKF